MMLFSKTKAHKHLSYFFRLNVLSSQEVNNIRQMLYDFPWTNVGRLTFLVCTLHISILC